MHKQQSATAPWHQAGTVRTALLLVALSGLAVLAAACGSSPGDSVANLGSSTTTTTPSSPAASSGTPPAGAGGQPQGRTTLGMGGVSVQFSQCMRSHGLPSFPDPNAQGQVQLSGVSPTSTAFRSAQQACAKYGPSGGRTPTAAQQQRALANALKYSQCMRSHGVSDFPDPQSHSGGGISITFRGGHGSDLDPNTPQFQAAQKACQPLMPGAKLGSTSSAAARG